MSASMSQFLTDINEQFDEWSDLVANVDHELSCTGSVDATLLSDLGEQYLVGINLQGVIEELMDEAEDREERDVYACVLSMFDQHMASMRDILREF